MTKRASHNKTSNSLFFTCHLQSVQCITLQSVQCIFHQLDELVPSISNSWIILWVSWKCIICLLWLHMCMYCTMFTSLLINSVYVIKRASQTLHLLQQHQLCIVYFVIDNLLVIVVLMYTHSTTMMIINDNRYIILNNKIVFALIIMCLCLCVKTTTIKGTPTGVIIMVILLECFCYLQIRHK